MGDVGLQENRSLLLNEKKYRSYETGGDIQRPSDEGKCSKTNEDNRYRGTGNQESVPKISFVMWMAMIFYSCGISMGLASMRQYVYKYIEDSYNSTHEHIDHMHNESETQTGCDANTTSSKMSDKEAANWFLYYELVEYSVVFPVMGICGIYSDFIGRKPFIILPCFGGIVEYTMFTGVIYFRLPLYYFFIGYAVAGLTGSSHTLFMACSASIADTTMDSKSRSFLLACIYLCLGLGVTAAQFAVGIIIRFYGYAIPCIICVSFMLVALLLFCNMTETYNSKSDRKSFCHSLKRIIGFYYDKSYLNCVPKWKFLSCLFAFILAVSPAISRSNTETLYLLGEPFCFSSEQIGYYTSSRELIQLTLGTLLLRLLHRCVSDEIIVLWGCLSSIASFCIEAFSTTTWMIYLGAGCGVLSLMLLPILRSFISKMVYPDKQGAVFANIYLMETASELFSNSLFLSIYANTQTLMPGFVFLAYALFSLLLSFILIPITISNKRTRDKTIEIKQNG